MSKLTDPIRDQRRCPKCGLDTIDARMIEMHIEICPDDWPAPSPRKLTVNNREQGWTREVWQLWHEQTKGRWRRDERVTHSNYFTPRPYVDEHNTGSSEAGFCYTVEPGCRVSVVQWVPTGAYPEK